jgi:hypothetical protein
MWRGLIDQPPEIQQGSTRQRRVPTRAESHRSGDRAMGLTFGYGLATERREAITLIRIAFGRGVIVTPSSARNSGQCLRLAV